MGGSKDEMQECKCPQGVPQRCNMKWKLSQNGDAKCNYAKQYASVTSILIRLCDLSYCKETTLTCNYAKIPYDLMLVCGGMRE